MGLDMRIATWNVEHAKKTKLDGLRSVLARHEADIWVLTETNDCLVPPNLGYVAHSGPRPKGVEGGRHFNSRWVSIWSRYPILHPVATRDKNNRTVAALIDAPWGRVLMFGTVLPWPASKPTFAEAVAEQAVEWLSLQSAYPDALFCVAGDLNTNWHKSWPKPGKVGNKALEEALRASGLVCATAPEKVPVGWLEGLPLDHVLLPADCSATVTAAWEGTTPDGEKLSDHSGLLVSAKLDHTIGDYAPASKDDGGEANAAQQRRDDDRIERRAEELRADQRRQREEYRKMREHLAADAAEFMHEREEPPFVMPSKEWMAKAVWTLRGELSRGLDEATNGKAEVAEPFEPEIIPLDGPPAGDVGVWFYKELVGRVVRKHVLDIAIHRDRNGTAFHAIGSWRGETVHELSLEAAIDLVITTTIEAMAQSVAAGCRLLAKDDMLVANTKNAG